MFLNINSTQFDQSSPVHPNSEDFFGENCKKNTFFQQQKLKIKKLPKKNAILDQSSPAQPISESRGGGNPQRDKERTKNLQKLQKITFF